MRLANDSAVIAAEMCKTDTKAPWPFPIPTPAP